MPNSFRLDRRGFLKGAAAGAGALGADALLPRAAEAADEILVGGINDESGFLDFAGTPMAKVLKFAVEEINGKGGLLGKKLRLIDYDAQSSMQLYPQYAQQLALKDRAAVVMGGITSASREVIRPVLHKYKTLYFYNVEYEGGVCDQNCFCTSTTPSQNVEHLVAYVIKTWGKKIYVPAPDYNYGQIVATWIQQYAKQYGGEVTAVEFFPLTATDYGPAISKIQAAKPDAIVSVLVNNVFNQQWAAAGMAGKIPFASTAFGSSGTEAVTLSPQESNGVLSCLSYFADIDTPANREFVSKLTAFYGKDTPIVGEICVTTYEAMLLWAKAVQAAGSVDRMAVIKALETGIGIDGPSGKVTIDPKSHHVIRDVHLAQMQDRKWKVLENYPQQPPGWTSSVCDLMAKPNSNEQVVFKL